MIIKKGVNLSLYSSYKIGGPAAYFFEAKNAKEILRAINEWHRLCSGGRYSGAIFILGGGTNILISDKGVKGLVIKPNLNYIRQDGLFLRVGAGVPITQLLNYSITKELSGLEWAGGLPGTIGGAIRGNAGAFGGELKDVIEEVVSLNLSQPSQTILRNNKQCEFSYRSSIFKTKKSKEVIIGAVLKLRKGNKNSIRKIVNQNIKYRKTHQPLEYPNIGSIFKNIPLNRLKKSLIKPDFPIKKDPFPLIPAAYLIAEAGLKRGCCGGAMISPKHPNFIVNFSQATAADVKNLINLAKKTVKTKFNIQLEEEIECWE